MLCRAQTFQGSLRGPQLRLLWRGMDAPHEWEQKKSVQKARSAALVQLLKSAAAAHIYLSSLNRVHILGMSLSEII